MVSPLVPEFESHFVPRVSWLKDLPLYSVRGTLKYVAAPLLVPAWGSSCWWLLDRVWAALISTHMYDIFSTYTRVSGSVSIHNLRTVAPPYGELLALLVYLTPIHQLIHNPLPRPSRLLGLGRWCSVRWKKEGWGTGRWCGPCARPPMGGNWGDEKGGKSQPEMFMRWIHARVLIIFG
jgi:hypothetical protein